MSQKSCEFWDTFIIHFELSAKTIDKRGLHIIVKNFYKFNADRVKFVDDISAAAKGYEYMAEIQLKSGVTV